MHSRKQPQVPSSKAQSSTDKRPGQPAVIAVRKRCEADGVGLSHYILMDRKPVR